MAHAFGGVMLAVVLATLAATSGAYAQSTPPLGTLDGLTRPRDGKLAHFSSHDRSGGNADFVPVAPGETVTLVDYKGAGTVRRWWVTIAPFNNPRIQRQTIVRCYWDGEKEPSVEVPVSDFFGVGFGEYKNFISLPLNMTSGGYNCYWPMPFKKSARITIENRSKVKIDALYYNVDLETTPKPAKESLYFHAQFRRQSPTEQGKPVTLLETTGRGHYVGTLLSMQKVKGRGLWFLEGDERVFVDGEKEPSVIGTGTEDYFSSGWYFNSGPYSAPYHGITIKDDDRSRISAYRWHIEDVIPFTKSLRFDIEHGGTNDTPGADYTSVAFWYQTHPHAPFPPLPVSLLPIEPFRITGMIEGEKLLAGAKATGGRLEAQDMGNWEENWSAGGQLWWLPNRIGERLTLTLTAPEAGEYEIIGYFTKAKDYGDVKVSINDTALSPVISGYDPEVKPTGPLSLGRVALKAGANTVTVEVVGKDARSTGYLFGLDGVVLLR
jgi:hypothetical protein